MYKKSTDVAELLENKVTAQDVLRVYRDINNCNLSNKSIIDLENELLINSFNKNKLLFSNNYLYYKISLILKDIGIFEENEQKILDIYRSLLNYIRTIINNDFNNIQELDNLIDEYVIEKLYMKIYNSKLEQRDVLKLSSNFNQNEIKQKKIKSQYDLLINFICENELLSSNKFICYKLIAIIKKVGLLYNNDRKIINYTFNTILRYSEQLSKSNLDDIQKIKKINYMYLDYITFCDSSNSCLVDLNKKYQLYDKFYNNCSESEKGKVLIYS